MEKFVSIRSKLITNTMGLISVIFVILLSVITASNITTLNKNIEKSKKSIQNSLMAKGKTLAENNSLAMNGMAEDNAITAIQTLVASTVSGDDDLEYGIYMTAGRVPWVTASKTNPKGVPKDNTPLDDSLSQWASNLKKLEFKQHSMEKRTIIEFAAPVGDESNILGYIRYGISTRSMEKAIEEALSAGRATRNQSILIILAMGLISLLIGYLVVKQLAARITNPIGSLVDSSKIIAEGNYDVCVKAESNDEIGNLSRHFEAMRATIKKYTDHLQELIDEKMQQVNDILNNIDQGLFTVNLDGTINNEYSARANTILKVSDVAACTIKDLLRFDAKQEEAFHTWLKLVEKKHTQQRWGKLAKLAPVQEIELLVQPETRQMEYIAIAYQRIYDKKGQLSKIMILALDETEKRLKDMQMQAERLKHENDVKAILSIANTPAEEIAEFMEDSMSRMRELHTQIDSHLAGVKKQRETHPGGEPYVITKDHVDRLYRDLHTLKGNGGSYGFEMLSHFAHEAEDRLEKLREPIEDRRDITLAEIAERLAKMDQAMTDIHEKIKLIFGKEEEITVRIPEARISGIVDLSRRVEPRVKDSDVKLLITECIMLSWKPLKTLLRKYQKLAMKVARKVSKNISFIITEENALFPNTMLTDIDDVLIHLIRNSVDHGIEAPEVREELGKGVGRIQISFVCKENKRVLTIADDGRGMDFESIIEKSIEKNLISREKADHLSPEEVTGLLFRGGVSTSSSVTDISGRGMGMQIIHDKITDLKGTLTIDSKLGKGTSFIITLPLLKESNGASA
jgi:HPt (histidine-containing phosphotransfer) domain-containing protein/HAMP domain-containing protein